MAQQLDQAVIANYRGMTTAVQGLDKAQDSASRSANKMNREIAAGGQHTRTIKSQTDETSKLATTFKATGVAVAAVTAALNIGGQAMEDYMKRMAGINKEFAKFYEKSQQIASGGGNAEYGFGMAQDAARIATYGVAGKDKLLAAAGAFKGVAKSASKDDIEHFMAMAQQAATGGEGDLEGYGEMTGAFVAGGMDRNRAANLAGLVMERGGKDAKRIAEKMRYLISLYGTKDVDKYAALLLGGAYGGRTGMSAVTSEVDKWVDKGGGGGDEMIDYVMSTMTEQQRAGYQTELGQVKGYDTYLADRMQRVSATNSRWVDHVAAQQWKHRKEYDRIQKDPLYYTRMQWAEDMLEQDMLDNPKLAAAMAADPTGLARKAALMSRMLDASHMDVVGLRRQARKEILETVDLQHIRKEIDAGADVEDFDSGSDLKKNGDDIEYKKLKELERLNDNVERGNQRGLE